MRTDTNAPLLATLLLIAAAGCAAESHGDGPQAETAGQVSAMPALRVSGAQVLAGDRPIRLRGIDWGWWHLGATRYSEDDMRRQAGWGANVARLAFSYGDLEDKAKPGTWREDGFAQLDEVVRWARTHGQYLILDMHVAPGGQDPAAYCDGGRNLLWKDPQCEQRFQALWCEIARRYRDRPEVAAYELLNEPVTQKPTPDLLVGVIARAIPVIRGVDPGKILVVPGDQWSNAREMKDAIKVGDANVLYTFHFYEGGTTEEWLSTLPGGSPQSGSADWTRIECPITVPPGARAMKLILRTADNRGTAWFDEVTLRDAAGKVVDWQSQNFDKEARPYAIERKPGEGLAWDPAVGHDHPGSLRLGGISGYNGWIGPRLEVGPGSTWTASAWVKLDGATGGTCITAAFYGITTATIDAADLRRRIEPAVGFARKFQVPVWVGEFGAGRDDGPPGLQQASIRARIDLFEELGFHWTYWNFRESTHPGSMALHAQDKAGKDYPLNEELLSVLRAGWARNAAP